MLTVRHQVQSIRGISQHTNLSSVQRILYIESAVSKHKEEFYKSVKALFADKHSINSSTVAINNGDTRYVGDI